MEYLLQTGPHAGLPLSCVSVSNIRKMICVEEGTRADNIVPCVVFLPLEGKSSPAAMADIIATRRYFLKERFCFSCLNRMPPIRDARENGAAGIDWESRPFHSNCFKFLCDKNRACLLIATKSESDHAKTDDDEGDNSDDEAEDDGSDLGGFIARDDEDDEESDDGGGDEDGEEKEDEEEIRPQLKRRLVQLDEEEDQ